MFESNLVTIQKLNLTEDCSAEIGIVVITIQIAGPVWITTEIPNFIVLFFKTVNALLISSTLQVLLHLSSIDSLNTSESIDKISVQIHAAKNAWKPCVKAIPGNRQPDVPDEESLKENKPAVHKA